MRRGPALAAAAIAVGLAPAAAGAALSTTHYVGPSPVQVAAEGDDVWVLFNDGVGPRVLRRLDARALRVTGPAVAVGTGGSAAPFRGREFVRTPLVAAYGSAWVIDESSSAILRVAPDGRIRRIPVAGAPHALAIGPGGLWALDACRRAPAPTPAAPCAGRALLEIDPDADTATERVVFDEAASGAELRTLAPRELAVGEPGTFWVSRRLGRLTRISNGVVAADTTGANTVLGSGRAALWTALGCSLRSTSGTGRLRELRGVLAEPGRGCDVRGIAIGPRGNLWTALATGPGRRGRVVAVNARTGGVEKYRDTGRDPVAIAAGAGGVWVVNRGDGTLTRYPTATTAPAPRR